MRNQTLLVSTLFLLGAWSINLGGEIGVVRPRSAATRSVAADGTAAAPSLFETPSIGYVFEPETQALRPILGAPGAAVIGSKVDLGMTLRRAWVSPLQSFMLAEVDGSPEVVLIGLHQRDLAAQTLPDLPIGADRVAISPAGTAMAFYFHNDNRLQITFGLPDSPEVGPRIDLADLPGLPSSLAVSDNGRAVLLAFKEAETGSVYLILPEQKRVIAQARDVRAITFLTNSLNAVIADTAANEVRLLNDVTGATTTQILAGESQGISHPLALQVATDNSRVFVLNSGAEAVTTVDLTTGLLAHLPINGSASKLQRLGGDVFQLTDNFRQPTLLFDAASPEPRIVFVPRVPSESPHARSAFRDPVSDRRRPLPLQ